MSSINPFSYGKPIDDPARFIGRRREIEQVYSRLLSAFESSAIVGERRAGKTSLLKILGHADTLARFNLDPQKYHFIYQDFLFLDENTTPSRFWQRVLKAMRRAVAAHEGVVAEIDFALKAETIDNYALDDIFTLIDEESLYVVLLLDEFEQVTRNRNFDNDFFGGLRALAIHHNLALITSSRQDLVQLTHSEQVRSSPFFNIFATINLRNFTEQDATELITRYLNNTGVTFLLSELNIIFAIAGYNPYFLQMACHHLFSAHQQGLADRERRHYLAEEARRDIDALFKDIWTGSTPSQQILLTVMALRELERKAAKPKAGTSTLTSTPAGEDTVADLERFYARASQVIGDLENRGLIIKNPDTSAYHLFSTELCEWIADEIVGDTADLRAWREWQKDETMVGKLALNVKDMLAQVVDGLNAEYKSTLGNWLLERPTQMPALLLMQTFVSRYEQYKETRTERDATATMAVDHAPVGDTPKGVFALVNQRLDNRQRGVFSIPPKPAAGTGERLDQEYRDVQVAGIKRQLIDQTRNLNKLLEQAATYGSRTNAPLNLQNELDSIEATIAELRDQLAELEADA
ncbi:MAG: hypothetical protein DPW09_13250 [Anaerolineae bacterium]|nr:AAA-like domain-containing protein [Anaerolineales bacterium]MCQ3974407.1 hypothetical protein [Anaerolineae bacterium]